MHGKAATTNHVIDQEALRTIAERVEAYLRAFLEERSLPRSLHDAAEYALLGGGKRLRPVLVVQSCGAAGGTLDDALPAAAAVEMIHTFSLVHDDLPAMDDDSMRRGRPTLHVQTSDAMAILAGDLLSSLAFELLTTRVEDAKRCAALVRELARGTNDMIAGQVYDTLPAADDIPRGASDMDRLVQIHQHKTAALLVASCRMGAICGGAGDQPLAALTRYARAIGLMFQVVDDVLDVTQSTEQLGKTAGKDVQQGKLTYPALLGLERARQEVDRLRDEAHRALAPLGAAAAPLRALCDYMAVRES